MVLAVLAASGLSKPAKAATGINQQINYQARLLTNSGAIVPDGDYNLEFKIYQDGTGCVTSGTPPCSGTLKWTETRTGSNKVTVRNGYFSVQLGSVTAFGTSVDWNQDTLWLSINIGGTGSPSWDGEMTPFRRLAAVPYAFNSKQLGGLDASQFVQLAPTAVQVDSGTLSSIFLNKTGASGNILQLQKNGADVLALANSGALTLTYNSTSATAGNEFAQTITVTDTGAVTSGTDETRGISAVVTRTGGSGTAVVNTTGGYFQAIGDTGGTSTAMGVQAIALGADTNVGFYGGGISVGTAAASSITGVLAGANSFFSTTSSATDVQGLRTAVGIDGGTATFTNLRGILVSSTTNTSGGTITNNYGIHIETQTAGASNYGLRVDTATTQTVWIAGNDASATTAAKGIAFGSAKDVTLYRGGADQLKTDDALNIVFTDASAFKVQNNSAADTILTADTSARSGIGGNLVKIGDSTGTDTATTILQVDSATANPTSNLSALNGGIFYNSTSGKMSIIEGGAVKVLCNTTDAGCGSGGSSTLQSAYNATSGNTIVATDGRDLAFSFPDTTTDPNFTINLQCVTSCGSNGRFAIQSAGTDAFTIAPTGNITATKHMALGASASVSAATVLAMKETTTLTSGGYKGQENEIHVNAASASSLIAMGLDSTITVEGTSINYTGTQYGASGGVNNDTTGTTTTGIGNQGYVNNRAGGTVTNAAGVLGFVLNSAGGTIGTASGLAGQIIIGSSGTISTASGLNIVSAVTGGGTITANYGIKVDAQTAGAADYGVAIGATDTTAGNATLWISNNTDSTTATGGITFGSSKDTNLYRDAANSLKTDDKLTAAGLVTTAANTVQFNDSDNSNFVAFKSASTVSSNVTWTLPSVDSAGCFQSDGSGTVSIAACGDTNVQTFSSSGDYTLPTNALMVIVEAWGGGGGGGGGTGGTTAAVRSGGAGGGGGAYATTIITGSTIGTAGTVVKVTVGTGGTAGAAGNGAVGTDGGAGGATCFSTSTSCSGGMYLQTFGGGGGNGNGTAGNGGGGGGGNLSVGTTNGTAATGGAGGSPLGAGAGAMNSGFGGAGGATAAATGAAGGTSGYGGAGGGSSSSTGAGNSGAGGGSTQGGAAGGAGGSCAITTCTQRSGGAGGHVPGLSGGGGTAGSGAGTAGGNGNAGVGSGGDGGGGGANNAAGTGGAGGTGGSRGGGGGGGGAGETTLGGAGGAGGAGYLRTWTLRGAGADLAEMYNSFETDLMAGDVVAIDGSLQSGVKKTTEAYDHNTIGIISTKPGLVLGDETNGQGANTVMVALAGRVPVKVSLENGPINVGDPLTPSSTPGVAMKATKYGPIIGQAMTAYTGDGPGYVVVFIKNSHSNGSKLSDALQSVSAKYQDPNRTLAQNALAFFSEDGKVKADAANVSEIYTDRVAAAAEVVTPQVSAKNVSTDSITSSTGKDIDVNLKESGKISIKDAVKEEVANIDDKGNATFKGTLVADKIKANQIEGLEVYTNKLDTLAAKQESQTQQPLESSTSASPSSLNISNFTASTATINQDFTANGTLFANGAIKVAGPADFLGESTFFKLASFIDKVVFKNNVNFEGKANFQNTITVNSNTAGTIKLPPGQTSIKVLFSTPYIKSPVVNVTPVGIIQPKYGVNNITKDGFEVQIDPAQTEELQFNWFAVESN